MLTPMFKKLVPMAVVALVGAIALVPGTAAARGCHANFGSAAVKANVSCHLTNVVVGRSPEDHQGITVVPRLREWMVELRNRADRGIPRDRLHAALGPDQHRYGIGDGAQSNDLGRGP